MEKATLSIFECKPGMEMAETIHNDFGAVMIREGTILDRQILNRIESMGILEVKIYVQDIENLKANHNKNISSKYEQNTQDIKNIMGKVAVGAPLDMTKIREITDTISSGIYSSSDMVGPLSLSTDIENYIFTHNINVSFMAMTIGKWMGCSEKTIKHLTQAGLLHDIGKCKISNDILNKPGELTDKEYDTIKQHPRYSYDILNEVDSIHNDVLLGILTHHEREDGTGYPLGITSEKINLIGKIVAVADIYDAMTSERIYRKSQTPFEVFELMQNGSFGKLHPIVLNKFIKNMAEHYRGSKVELSNGEEGEVVFINYNKISKPIVKVDGKFIDLSLERGLKINRIFKNNNKI
ncbi:MAG TPA: HD-GYP domain-containing protein [Epulopiscium sp.]|nr:HD-GYP domain-containing protein [Candidatus Epulonipiscium sp.]